MDVQAALNLRVHAVRGPAPPDFQCDDCLACNAIQGSFLTTPCAKQTEDLDSKNY